MSFVKNYVALFQMLAAFLILSLPGNIVTIYLHFNSPIVPTNFSEYSSLVDVPYDTLEYHNNTEEKVNKETPWSRFVEPQLNDSGTNEDIIKKTCIDHSNEFAQTPCVQEWFTGMTNLFCPREKSFCPYRRTRHKSLVSRGVHCTGC